MEANSDMITDIPMALPRDLSLPSISRGGELARAAVVGEPAQMGGIRMSSSTAEVTEIETARRAILSAVSSHEEDYSPAQLIDLVSRDLPEDAVRAALSYLLAGKELILTQNWIVQEQPNNGNCNGGQNIDF